ncbi:putative malate dehydrogenase, partial [Vibrio harveyi]
GTEFFCDITLMYINECLQLNSEPVRILHASFNPTFKAPNEQRQAPTLYPICGSGSFSDSSIEQGQCVLCRRT